MGINVAILFGYNGAGFSGLERVKGEKAVESIVLSALATLTGKASGTESVTVECLSLGLQSLVNQPLFFTLLCVCYTTLLDLLTQIINISRAAATEEGEHAARQLLSLEIAADDIKIPTPDALNALLPEAIRIFKVVAPTAEGFSARRSCETRTYEYLIPTYAFMAPNPAAGYDYVASSVSKEDLDNMYPDADPEVDRSGEGSLFTTLRRLGRSRSRSLGRSNSRGRSANRSSVPPEPLLDQNSPTTPTTASGGPLNFFASLTRRRSTTKASQPNISETNSIANLIPAASNSSPASSIDEPPQFYDPIDLPYRGADTLRGYRMTEEQLDIVRSIVAIYRGTHNWHNYVPGANQDDQRCFMRIINIESGSPEIHNGMEWLRIKVQAKAMARFQFRRMMALLVLVVRTNTPRSVIANSFGISKVNIPEAPSAMQIFHQPLYTNYNAVAGPGAAINFDDEKSQVEKFRKQQIHEAIYAEERESLAFEDWLRDIDRVAFLYKYFLNARGLIGVQNAYVRGAIGGVDESLIYNVR
ncbi:tRNA pseudouridine synthase 1 [Physocladia obscura]|uniref:tRNA pseudouridine synthase 1 n=1 Tax=Physocladia obscura TaxID=109957 RepID=A0AAD5XK04_9FUNG|nr:tRNA pseudouridine synthase 1 [Physocladia obscura]